MNKGPRIHNKLREKLKENLGVNLPELKDGLQQSSIDRFFWSKGGRFIGNPGGSWQLALAIIGGSQLLATLVFLILAVLIPGFPKVLPIIFGSVGIVTFGLTYLIGKRTKKIVQPEVRISGSGRKLLYKIGQHIGWHDQNAWQAQNANPWGTWWQSIVGIKTASNVLTPKSAELLEEGCSEYNKIAGLLKLSKDSKGRSANLAPQIQAASDEAMISLINQVALLEETPESQTAIISQCRSHVSKLEELAERFEEILSGPVTLADRLSSTTVMDNVLDQMRLEAQAHEELRMDNFESQIRGQRNEN